MSRRGVIVLVLVFTVVGGTLTAAHPASPSAISDPSGPVILPSPPGSAGPTALILRALSNPLVVRLPSGPTAGPNNPWGADPIIVTYSQDASDGRDYRPLVADALAYWSDNAGTYTSFDEVSFRLVDETETTDPDVRIVFIDTIPSCGSVRHADSWLGCAPVFTTTDPTRDVTTIRVKTGVPDATLRWTLKHEIGHTLGLSHGDEPRPIMNSKIPATSRSSDPKERTASGGATSNRTAFVEVPPGVTGTERTRSTLAVERGVPYDGTGADGWPSTPISYTTGDGSIDRSTRYVVAPNRIPPARYERWTGYRLGFALGADTNADVPDRFNARNGGGATVPASDSSSSTLHHRGHEPG